MRLFAVYAERSDGTRYRDTHVVAENIEAARQKLIDRGYRAKTWDGSYKLSLVACVF